MSKKTWNNYISIYACIYVHYVYVYLHTLRSIYLCMYISMYVDRNYLFHGFQTKTFDTTNNFNASTNNFCFSIYQGWFHVFSEMILEGRRSFSYTNGNYSRSKNNGDRENPIHYRYSLLHIHIHTKIQKQTYIHTNSHTYEYKTQAYIYTYYTLSHNTAYTLDVYTHIRIIQQHRQAHAL